jgi:hypothetical protein
MVPLFEQMSNIILINVTSVHKICLYNLLNICTRGERTNTFWENATHQGVNVLLLYRVQGVQDLDYKSYAVGKLHTILATEVIR